ncbi:hypothetical protein NP233_g10741 [Leucocoprinus birnbaumii]|uniref:Uncharacterized protein n=1 Tax=Leucocoprinus birnbaumii TaxID=56174 RepID=A0AAD5VIP4_9AGAR|nr:hypothetical protein NP233_g10741 [Leucocoprinus birnbaumii]
MEALTLSADRNFRKEREHSRMDCLRLAENGGPVGNGTSAFTTEDAGDWNHVPSVYGIQTRKYRGVGLTVVSTVAFAAGVFFDGPFDGDVLREGEDVCAEGTTVCSPAIGAVTQELIVHPMISA